MSTAWFKQWSASALYAPLNTLQNHSTDNTVTYEVYLNTVSNIIIPDSISSAYLADTSRTLTVSINATFFDLDSRRFYGSTFSGDIGDCRVSGDNADITIDGRVISIHMDNHELLFHTDYASPLAVLVVEICLNCK
jgi:hypothetical protein